MRIAIPTLDAKGYDSKIAEHFGRAPFFTVIETETGKLYSRKNNGQHFGGHARPGKMMQEELVETVLCANLGRKALVMLRESGTRVFTGASGTVRQAFEAFNSGKLSEPEEDSVCCGGGRHSGQS